jgi:glycosyltransferase involved in cell wall biosynthesis
MKIVHVITRLILGGAQENTLLTVEGLHRGGRDSTTLVTGPAEGPEGDLFDRANRGGLDVRIVPELVRAIRPAIDLRAYLKLRRLFRELKPDVVHTHSSKAGVLGRAAAWAERVPLIVHTIHGLPFGPSESPARNVLYIAIERWSARRCHAIVSVCHAMTEQALAANVGSPEQYQTIYSGMDVDSFLNPPRRREEVRNELGLTENAIAFGTVARLFERKGHDDILAAAPIVLKHNPNVRFVFIGDGILRDRLKAEAERLGVGYAVIFVGLVPPDRIPELLHAVDAVVHPSLREGLARVLPQALICERPVISYDVDGAREVVLPETGVLLPRRSVEDLAAAILKLADDRKLRDALGREGRRRFAEQFRHETMTAQIRELYERKLAENPSRSKPKYETIST